MKTSASLQSHDLASAPAKIPPGVLYVNNISLNIVTCLRQLTGGKFGAQGCVEDISSP